MIEQQGRVVRVEGTQAEVRMGRTGGCARCEAGQGCGAGLFAKLLNRRHVNIWLPNTAHAPAGAAVLVGIHERLLVRLVWGLYGLPLLAALAGGAMAFGLAVRLGWPPFALDLATGAGAVAAAMVALRCNRDAPRRWLKPNTDPGGLYPKIRMLEVNCESN